MQPFILFKAKLNLSVEWTEDKSPDPGYATSPLGWMMEAQFLEWFKMFVKFVR